MKHIVVFSDGTGNSSAKFFKTNVWRLYQAIDLSVPDEGAVRQVVDYDSGVGTSSFKPLALLGGAFGVGLKRNVLDLYRFICRHYEPGDRIYAFGFSRGAFTIRVLIGLIAQMGVVRATDKLLLDLLTSDAYREFRRCFRLSGDRLLVGNRSKRFNRTDLVVEPLRNLRDRLIRRKRARHGLPYLDGEHRIAVDEVAFVGVWDTVAAYGFPIAEITKGIDKWVWPLSMPDYKLSEKVRRARHALALDDERDTFHPLLWDEVHERRLVAAGKVDESRMRQVWFTGMHSDVGGGYPDDSLAYVSLVWMAEEAVAAGLRLQPDALDELRRAANPNGPMHNSRSGVGAYYRYQPRKISARLEKPDTSTLLQQDPDLKGHGLLAHVRVHESVMARIAQGTDHYAPIVLPGSYEVMSGPPPERHSHLRAKAQERVWDDVWRRRVNYFLTLIVTLWTVLFPFMLPPPAESCVGPQCVISPVIGYIAGWLPDFASPLLAGYAARPGLFLVSVLIVFLLMKRASRLETGLRDRMHRLFVLSRSADAAAAEAIGREQEAKPGFVRKLRTSRGYQKAFHAVKWNAGPALAAVALYACGVIVFGALLVGVLGGAHRAQMSYAESTLAYCNGSNAPSEGEFSTDDMCWRLESPAVEQGKRYRVRIVVDQPWHDKSIHASPAGFGSDRFGWPLRWWAPLLRRSFADPWFQPLVTVVNGHSGVMTSVPMKLLDLDRRIYSGNFQAPASGKLVFSVNDAVFLWGGDSAYFYRGDAGLNSGTANVSVEDCDGAASVPCD